MSSARVTRAATSGFGNAAHLEREGDILADGHVREQGVVLEHHADVAPIGRHLVDRLAGEEDLAMGRGLEASQHHQAGGLARARRPEHGQELAARDVEVEVLHDQRLAVVGLLDVHETDERVAGAQFRHPDCVSTPVATLRGPMPPAGSPPSL